MGPHNLRTLKSFKRKETKKTLQMLTCYDYQTATMLNETTLDMILVGDSLGNVILGHPTTIPVTIEEMKIFSRAVTRGATKKFIVADMPFGSYPYLNKGIDNAIDLYQYSQAQALKLEGACDETLKIISAIINNGIPVMGHIGLTPQSVHQMGGFYTHGKDEKNKQAIKKQAWQLYEAGCFSIVLECVEKTLAQEITDELPIPIIGIGSGRETDGQVLVINDLFRMGADRPPQFCQPIDDFFTRMKTMVEDYIQNQKD